MKTLTKVVISILLFSGSNIFAQGVALITPMSDVSLEASKVISYTIFNRLEKETTLTVQHYCDVDGKEMEGMACEKYLRVSYSKGYKNDRLKLPAKTATNVKIQVRDFGVKYVLFKPKYEPFEEKKSTKGIRFIFGYQPGFLFLLKPNVNERLQDPDASIVTSNEHRLLQLNFDVSKLSTPQVVNITVRVTGRKGKKTLKLIKMATKKIVDPKRKLFTVQGIVGDKNFNRKICYQAYIKSAAENAQLYKINSCSVKPAIPIASKQSTPKKNNQKRN